MNKSISKKIFICYILFGAMVGCNSTKEKESKIPPPFGKSETLPANRFPVYPPSSGWLPGLVFKGSVTDEKLNVERIICHDLLPARKNPKGEVEKYHKDTLMGVKQHEDTSAKFGASLNPLELILGNNEVKFDLAKFQKQKTVEIDPGKVAHLYYMDSDQFREKENGEVAYTGINPSCQAAMNNKPENKEALRNNQLYLVTAVIGQTGIKYRFKNTIDFDTTLKVNFKKILDAAVAAGFNKTEEGGNTEISTESITTRTAKPELVTRWIWSGAIGGDETSAQITTKPEERNINSIVGFDKLRQQSDL